LVAGGDVKAGFQISMDSTSVVYRADGRINNVRELYATDIDGDSRRRLTKKFPKGGDVNEFEIASDSSTVVFRADQQTNNVKELFAVPLSDGALTKLNDRLPTGSDVRRLSKRITPDSTRVVFAVRQGKARGSVIRSTSLNGGAVTQLSLPVKDWKGGNIRISPDSVWVLWGDRPEDRTLRVRLP